MDADKERAVASAYNLDSFPTIVFIRNHQMLARVVGYDPSGVESAVNSNLVIEADTLYQCGVCWMNRFEAINDSGIMANPIVEGKQF